VSSLHQLASDEIFSMYIGSLCLSEKVVSHLDLQLSLYQRYLIQEGYRYDRCIQMQQDVFHTNLI